MKKYRLNYSWNEYKKGYVFEGTITCDNGFIGLKISDCVFEYLKETIFDLLVLSGALTEIKECDCKIKNKGIFINCCVACDSCTKIPDSEVKEEHTDYCQCPQCETCQSFPKYNKVKITIVTDQHPCEKSHSEVKKIEPMKAIYEATAKINEVIDAINLLNTKLK